MQSFFHILTATALASKLFMASASATPENHLLAQHSISLEDRYPITSVNQVFKDNILLSLNYMSGHVHTAQDINWESIEKPYAYTFTLEPDKTFAFHDLVLPHYKDTITQTTHADFSAEEGFKSDGYLYGDGVCHLASLIDWVAKDAGLTVVAPTAHDFAVIPDIAKENGVAIYAQENEPLASEEQNLYITNNNTTPAIFHFTYDGNILTVSIGKMQDIKTD